MIEDRHQLDLPAVIVAGTAQGLAVERHHHPVLLTRSQTTGLTRWARPLTGEQPAGQDPLQRTRVDRAQHPTERRGMRSRPAHADGLVGPSGPLGDRRPGPSAGQHRPQGKEQHRLQAVTTTAGPARIGHRRQRLQQRDRLARVQ
jgi:hypothetical protein